jgi:hypothetical protein
MLRRCVTYLRYKFKKREYSNPNFRVFTNFRTEYLVDELNIDGETPFSYSELHSGEKAIIQLKINLVNEC